MRLSREKEGLTKKESIDLIRERLEESAALMKRMARENAEAIYDMARAMASVLNKGGKILLCGNGGSAADAQHIAAELVVRLYKLERKALPVISLATNTSALTAEGNDHGFETIFSRQVEAYGRRGDLLIAISTSGNSANILQASERARRQGLKVIGMTGEGGGKLRKHCQILIEVPARHAGRIQEVHIMTAHIACELLERTLFGEP